MSHAFCTTRRELWSCPAIPIRWLACLGLLACTSGEASRADQSAADRAGQTASPDRNAPGGDTHASAPWLDASLSPASEREAGVMTLDAASARLADASDADAADASEVDAPSVLDRDGDLASDAIERSCGTDPDDARDSPDVAFARADGSADQPYPICLQEHLHLLLARGDVASAHLRLLRDLDLEGRSLASQLGSDTTPFAGTLDGASHTIRNFTLGQAELPLAGLIAVLGPGGLVHDLRLEHVSGFAGAVLAGRNLGTIRRVSVSASSSGSDHLGLLVNYNAAGALIEDAESAGQLSASKSHVGGLVGESYGLLRRCHSSVDVRAEHRAGGLVGSGGGAIEECFATGSVTGSGMYIGGLLGTARDGTRVADAYALGSVTADYGEAGGLVGSTQGMTTFERCYAANVVHGARAANAILGIVEPAATVTVGQCYFDASLTAQDAHATGLAHTSMSEPAAFVGFDFTTPVWRLVLAAQGTPRLAFQR